MKELQKKILEYLTITRMLELGWNSVAFLFHFLYLGIGGWTSIIIQITALLTEWLITGIYENTIFLHNINVNREYDRKIQKFWHKYVRFTITFVTIFISTYFLRLILLYWIGFDITKEQFQQAIMISIPVTLTIGPTLGFIYIARRKRFQERKKISINNRKIMIRNKWINQSWCITHMIYPYCISRGFFIRKKLLGYIFQSVIYIYQIITSISKRSSIDTWSNNNFNIRKFVDIILFSLSI